MDTNIRLQAAAAEQAELLPQIVEQHHGSGLAVAGAVGGIDGAQHPAALFPVLMPLAQKMGKVIGHNKAGAFKVAVMGASIAVAATGFKKSFAHPVGVKGDQAGFALDPQYRGGSVGADVLDAVGAVLLV